jgi:hypothetical protein
MDDAAGRSPVPLIAGMLERSADPPFGPSWNAFAGHWLGLYAHWLARRRKKGFNAHLVA